VQLRLGVESKWSGERISPTHLRALKGQELEAKSGYREVSGNLGRPKVLRVALAKPRAVQRGDWESTNNYFPLEHESGKALPR